MSALSVTAINTTRGKQPLPPGWRWVRLKEIAGLVSGGTPPKDEPGYWGGDIPFVTGADITEFQIGPQNARAFLSPKGLQSGKTAVCQPGTVLLVTRTRVGRVGVAAQTIGASQDLTPLTCGPQVITNYLCWYLRSISSYLLENCRGSTIIGLTHQFVKDLPVPIPALAEQHRIADLLTKQMAAVERPRAATMVQLESTRELLAACLKEVFEGPDANHWPRFPLGSLLASPLRMGVSKAPSPDGVARCLSLSAVRKGSLDVAASKNVQVTEREAASNWVKPGAFYVVRGNGNISLVGRGGMAPDPLPQPVLYPDLLIEVQVEPSRILPSYLRWVWDSPQTRLDIENRARTAAGIYKINQANLVKVILPVPSLTEQECIVSKLTSRFEQIEALCLALEEQLDHINKLPAALLTRAFTGGL